MHVKVHARQRNTNTQRVVSSAVKALGEAVNKRFSVSPRWKVPLLIRRARGLRKRADETERIELEGPLRVSTKLTVG